jgi:hypothetical protein
MPKDYGFVIIWISRDCKKKSNSLKYKDGMWLNFFYEMFHITQIIDGDIVWMHF